MARIIKDYEFKVIPGDLKVPSDKDWKLGDIIFYANGKHPLIVGIDGKLIKQVGNSDSLLIPYDRVIKFLTDPWNYYSKLFKEEDVGDGSYLYRMELNDCLPTYFYTNYYDVQHTYNLYKYNKWEKAIVSYRWGKFNYIWMNFGNGLKKMFRDPDVTFEDILNWYIQNTKQTRVSLEIYCKDFKKCNINDTSLKIPKTWCSEHITDWIGVDFSSSLLKEFIGPIDKLEEVVQTLKEHYQKANVLEFSNFKLYGAIKDVE